jgi:hypothetical protein
MDNTNVGNGNISKKIGYSITDEQLKNIAAKVSGILNTISNNKADKANSLAGYGISDGLSFVEGYADEIDDYYSTDNEPKLYKIIQEGRMMLMNGFVPYYLYAGTIHPLVDGKGTELYQYKITSNGILFRKGNRKNNANTWGSWGLLGSGGSGGAVSSVNGHTGEVNLKLEDINKDLTADGSSFQYESPGTYFSVGVGGLFANGDVSGGYALTVGVNGIYIRGNPYNDNDIILVQHNWVDKNDQSQGVIETTHKLSGKANKPNVLKWESAGKPDFVLEDNQEAYFSNDEMALLTITMPNEISDDYHSNFCFKSGTPPTSLSYPADTIIWVGDDCDSDGAFIPEANTRYEVCVKKLGSDIVARVGAY